MEQTLSGKKVLILYTAHTFGHQRIAENLAWWLRESGGSVELREVLKSSPSPLVQKYLQLHIWVNTYIPWFWKFLYMRGFWFSMPLRLVVARLNSKSTRSILAEVKPDVVITTQTSPSAVMSALKRSKIYTGLWGIAFSDYHFHRYWAYPRADFYLTNIEEQAQSLRRLGVATDQIFRVGMALPPKLVVDVEVVRKRLGLEANSPVLLVGSGTLGVGLPTGFLQIFDQVCAEYRKKEQRNIAVIFLAGRNQSLYNELQEAQHKYSWLTPLSFYEPLAEVYAIADLMVSKPGGLTIAETIQQGVPVFVTHYLPGQEELNIKYLQALGAIVPLYVKPQQEWFNGLVQELITHSHRRHLVNHPEIGQVVRPAELEQLGGFIGRLFHK